MTIRRAAITLLVLVYLASLSAEWIAPAGYAMQNRDFPGAPPSTRFPLGTDELGRDLWARLLYGTRISLLLAPAASLLCTAIAALLGILAGYCGGLLDALVTRAADLFLSLPWIFLLLAVRAALPLNVAPVDSVLITFLLLGILGWAGPARIVAAEVRSLVSCDFFQQAEAAGCSRRRIWMRHLLPNLRPVLAAQFWMSIPVFILSEANLSVLGLGVGEPLPSWGSLLRQLENYPAVLANPWLLAPLLLLVAVVACFHLIVPMEDLTR